MGATRISGAFIEFPEIPTPSNPATDVGEIYCKDLAGVTTLFFLDSAGTETNLLLGGGGGEANTSSNVGTGEGLAKAKVVDDLPFKSLIGEVNRIVLTGNADDVTFTLGTEVVLNNQNNNFGAFYQDLGEITVPANPAANVRRLFVDSATGELSVRTNAGATVSLEAGGGGEANTISSQGGGTFTLTAAVPKSGVDLRVISVSNGDGMNASLAADILTLAVASTVVQTDQANTFGDFPQIFRDNQFKINSPDDADGVTFVDSDQTADRNLTIPVLTGNRTILVSGEGNIVNADINASAAIVLTKLTALTISRATETDGSGFIIASATTSAELALLSGATTLELQANKGAVSGYAGLDGSQELLLANFPTGSGLQVLRRNSGNTALEFATLAGGGDMVLADAQTVTGAKTFETSTLLLRNPVDTFTMTIVNAAIGSNLNLSMPVITVVDTLVARILAQTIQNKTLDSTNTIQAGAYGAGSIVDADISPTAEINVTKLLDGTPGQFIHTDSAGTGVEWTDDVFTINFIIDGGGSAITTGIKGQVVVDFDCEVIEWVIIGLPAGAIVVDVERSTFAGFPSTLSIAGTELPIIVATNDTGEDRTLTTWSAINAGDILEFEVDSVATIERCTVALKCRKTG